MTIHAENQVSDREKAFEELLWRALDELEQVADTFRHVEDLVELIADIEAGLGLKKSEGDPA